MLCGTHRALPASENQLLISVLAVDGGVLPLSASCSVEIKLYLFTDTVTVTLGNITAEEFASNRMLFEELLEDILGFEPVSAEAVEEIK